MSSIEKIIKIETIIPDTIAQEICLIRIHTENGIIGHGETYYIPQAVANTIHHWFAQRLLGANALDIESHWRFLYERCMNFGGKGAEMRALSAIDLALWDILGKHCNQPIWQLLGGKVRDRMPVYNSSGGRSYGRDSGVAGSGHGWPGMGDMGRPGPLEDNWASFNTPGDYAEELLKEGYKGVKVWALDELARTSSGPLYLNRNDIKKYLKPLHEIRERVGFDLEIMFDGHGFFQWPAAMRIAEELRDIKPLWIEDVIRPDCIDTIARFRREAGVPIAVSEMFTNIEDYRLALEKEAADYIMIDPTWRRNLRNQTDSQYGTSSQYSCDHSRLYWSPDPVQRFTGIFCYQQYRLSGNG